ncbi:MAG: ribosomal protein S18-alanine N-acetyltransferase [Candidatus Aminicenantales bacterium]
MREEDVPEVWAIERASFSNPWHKTAFFGEIHNQPISHPFVIVHSIEKKIIGYVIYWELEKEVQISNIAIHPDYRRMGIGEVVLRQIVSQLKEEKTRFVFLEVRPSNTAALNLYRKLEFRIVGIRPNYYSNPKEHAIIMGKNLGQ